jgi:hypothetical protein
MKNRPLTSSPTAVEQGILRNWEPKRAWHSVIKAAIWFRFSTPIFVTLRFAKSFI